MSRPVEHRLDVYDACLHLAPDRKAWARLRRDHDILAEEPGLGKTLECIALILLNPGVGRNPSTYTWDAEAKIHVKNVKVSRTIHGTSE